MTNVLFVNYWNFASNSATHVFNLANRLVRAGIDCAVAVPESKSTVETLGTPKFVACDYADLRGRWSPFKDGRGPDLIHAWTPREIVRKQTEALVARFGCEFIVHLEDNEELIFQTRTDLSFIQISRMSVEQLDERAGPYLSHPVRYRRFLEGSSGITAIIDTLFAFSPEGILREEIGAGYDEELFWPQDGDRTLRSQLGIADGDYVITYTGNAHHANVREMHSLYSAVGLLNRVGHRVKLVRCGQDALDVLGEELRFIHEHIVEVGLVPHLEIPRYLALADFLVQPGRADGFNDFRLPSKLPEFLAIGKPVILPNSNIGRRMRDGVDALVMQEGHSLDITRHVCRLINNPDLRDQLGRGGRAFAEQHLQWDKAAAKLLNFYERVLGSGAARAKPGNGHVRAPVTTELEELYATYACYHVPTIGYATVADYVDSLERLPKLSQVNRDIKDVQRPWMVKALLARVPRGSRLLEIGGGDPWVAELLSQAGYEVFVIDPYEGEDAGPADFERIVETHPQIEFIRGSFPEAMPIGLSGSFDAIYSISVVEHMPLDEIDRVFRGIRRFLRNAACLTIHAIDHVHKGNGSEHHLTMLRRVTDALGLPQDSLDDILHRLEDDPDAYFLSPEAHNLWRRSLPYEQFPMRRVVSVHFCTTFSGS